MLAVMLSFLLFLIPHLFCFSTFHCLHSFLLIMIFKYWEGFHNLNAVGEN